MVTILIVDDNEKIRKLMGIYLKRDGYQILEAEDGEEALEFIENVKCDVIIADVMMPKMDGFTMTKEIRDSGHQMPILLVTAKDTIKDKKQGFDMGADDYLTKPIDMEEMLMRVGALLRRAKISSDKRIIVGDIIIDSDTLEATTPDETIILPKKEFFLLYKLLSYPKKIFTRQDLMDDIWGYDTEADERTVDVHIKRLREKFNHVKEFEIITVRGLGYKAEKYV